MKGIVFLSGLISGLLTSAIILPAFSQVTSDNTTNTTINTNNNNFNILNGIQKGNNLFHSFKEFSIPTGGSATFQNSSAIENIINRVTGGNISNIDGLIKASGNANLFIINPSGIIFGENASLNIGGSFIGSTAESILFKDGFNYSAIDSEQLPLLTVSVPVGLQMGKNSGDIQVSNSGHNLSAPFRQPLNRGNNPSSLSVNPGNTLALIAGNLSLTGGILNAEDGRVELGAVSSPDIVLLNPSELGWNFDYKDVSQFGNIQLEQQTLVEVSAIGAIQLYGQNILFQDGSLLLIENRSNRPAIGIDVQATDTVEFSGTTPDKSLQSGMISDALNSGRGGDISISATKIITTDSGGLLRGFTFADADSSNISLSAKDIIWKGGEVDNAVVEIRTLGTGNGGVLEVNTEGLIMQDSALISNVNNGSGSAGSIIINATDSVELGPNVNQSTLIGSSAVSASGNAGSININTEAMTVTGGALISSSTFGSGNAGSITINASERLSIDGFGFNTTTNQVESTTIRTGGILIPERIQKRFRLPPTVTGNAGTLTINTPSLQIENQALVTVRHDSAGNAGKIEVDADTLILDGEGKITATTASGEGGNINLNLKSDLILRNNSLIDTEALGTGNGGNITINSPVIAGFENSDIIANAIQGNGGNIDITTQGIFGLEFRNELTEESDISASSEFGINGTVKINNFNLDSNLGLVELPVEVSDSSQQIASGCVNKDGNSFFVTKRGGIPQNPKERVEIKSNWSDIRDLSEFRHKNHDIEAMQISNQPQIVEATGFIRNSKGEIELVALGNTPLRTKQVADCSGLSS